MILLHHLNIRFTQNYTNNTEPCFKSRQMYGTLWYKFDMFTRNALFNTLLEYLILRRQATGTDQKACPSIKAKSRDGTKKFVFMRKQQGANCVTVRVKAQSKTSGSRRGQVNTRGLLTVMFGVIIRRHYIK